MNKEYNKLIQTSSQGLETSDYAEIVNAINNMYRNIYGFDIDLDPRTADGRFIYAISNIIYNQLQVISQLYNNLNPSTAQDKYLDILCSLTNVERESATRSVLKASITALQDITFTDTQPLILVDDNGLEWSIYGSLDNKALNAFTINKGTTQLYFECNQTGAISCTQLKSLTSQPLSASIIAISKGHARETDAELRERRKTASQNGVSTIEGLRNAFNYIKGIKDSYIYSNNTLSPASIYVNGKVVSLPVGSCAILLRYDDVIEPLASEIVNAIHNYITIGINTIGDNSYQFNFATTDNTTLNYTYSWYKCEGIKPAITINLTKFDTYSNNTDNLIKTAVIDYLNNLPINSVVNVYTLMQVIQGADPLNASQRTFYVNSVNMGEMNSANGKTSFTLQGQYFNISSNDIIIR